nr:rhomboid family intramembrane serine protease [Ramlibacter cellulosilyticus]
MLVFALFTALVALAAPRGGILFWLGVLFFGGLAWLLGKPLFTRDWIVRVGPRGISGYLLNGRTVPWRDVRDLRVETVQGNTFLVVDIAPGATDSLEKTKRWLSGRKTERRIVLNGLRKAQAAEAAEAAMATFAERARDHAAAAIEARQEEARAEAEFEQQLARHTKVTWALYLVVALNVGIWVLNLAAGMSPMRPSSQDLFRWGAISAWAVTHDHEYWRLLAGTFLHGGAVHLFMNMLGLWGAGKLLNRMVGNGQFLLVYLLSALAGASASLHFGAQTAVSVGASGAVFGVVGALVAAVRRRREHLPKAMVQQIMTSEAVFLAYALLNGFTRQGIDNAAHVGGLLAGAAMGVVLAGAGESGGRDMRRLRATFAAIVLAAAVGLVVATTPAPRVDHGRMFAATRMMTDVMPRAQAAIAATQKDVEAAKAQRITEDEFIRRVETVHLPAMRRTQAELAQVPRGEGDPRAFITVAMESLAAKMIEGLEVALRQHRGEARPGDDMRAEALKGEIEAIHRRMNEQAAALRK